MIRTNARAPTYATLVFRLKLTVASKEIHLVLSRNGLAGGAAQLSGEGSSCAVGAIDRPGAQESPFDWLYALVGGELDGGR